MQSSILCKGRVIVLSGPSGSGKTSLHDKLLVDPEFRGKIVRSISATTRLPRGQEKNGREYFFLSKKMFQYKIRSGQFLEWARVFDNFYGTLLKSVRDVLQKGQSVLLCIDVQGGKIVREKIPQAIRIFIKTPSIEVLRERLEARGTEDGRAVALRLNTARAELEDASSYDFVIVNDSFERAYEELKNILVREIFGECGRR